MKTSILTTFACLFAIGLVFAQNNDVKYRVIKEYDENGNIVRYDSTNVYFAKHSKNTIHYSFSDKFSDSLIEGLDFIGEKMRVFISDSIATHLDHFLDGKGVHIWMDNLNHDDLGEKYFLEWSAKDSLMEKNRIKFFYGGDENDSIRKIQLERELEKVEQRLKKKTKKKKRNRQ